MTCCLFSILMLLLIALQIAQTQKIIHNVSVKRIYLSNAYRKRLKKKKIVDMHILTKRYTNGSFRSVGSVGSIGCIKKKTTRIKTISFLHAQSELIKNGHRFFTLHVRGCTNIKPKTNKSIAKRFKITKNGKLIRKKAGRSHLLRKKTSSNKASLRKRTTIASTRIEKKYKSAIHT
ncbi:ribosomal protein L35 [Plasmodium gonderi]|uniref:50S ribosomal protein L35 n=1 Tax=Plasmodium gonderi TaxID=77519 RepID=A0A1Y1JI80_PLAGO|nr:ribosomal protein L35 [Plasmodium gonderi]GAW80143.1 ribosomal protein L35 [Plasmodium gonderi]